MLPLPKPGNLFIATCLLLVACERKPASHEPLTSRPTQAAAAPAPPTPLATARMVAPGLVVRIAPASPTDTAIGQALDQRLVLTIERNRHVIFQDTTTDGLAYSAYSEPQTKTLYPLWVPAGAGAGELLLAYSNRPGRDQVRRFRIEGQQVTHLDTLTAFDGPAKNLDQDARLEYSGYADYGEHWTDEQGHHRQTYNPVLYYEVRPTGLVLDTALTIRQNRARYGKFYGYRYSEQPVIVVK
ncbi:MAG: hypothetical protein ACRYFX_31160 [Janthinobacterium lividum]